MKYRVFVDGQEGTTGLRIHQVTEHWSRHYPWQGASHHDVAEEILDDIIERAKTHGRVMPGVEKLLMEAEDAGFRIGLALYDCCYSVVCHVIAWICFASFQSWSFGLH